jgi:hypothetical protein
MGTVRGTYTKLHKTRATLQSENRKRGDDLGELGTDARIILKQFKKIDFEGVDWILLGQKRGVKKTAMNHSFLGSSF